MTTRPNEYQRVASHGRGGAGKPTYTFLQTLSATPRRLQWNGWVCLSLQRTPARKDCLPLSHSQSSPWSACDCSPASASERPLTFAGNIAKDDPTNYPKPEDLVTPTLKSNTYTTGRGGTGNMARNDPERPDLARAAQDVESKPHPEPQGPKHYGRGGAANIIGDGQPAQRKSAEAKRKSEDEKREDNGKGLLGKGKDLLNKLGKK